MMRSGDLFIDNCVIFDGESEVLEEDSITVIDGVITEVGGRAPRDIQSLDAHGRFVMPGLIDAHFHAYGVSLDSLYNDHAPLSLLALIGARRLTSALHRGFTTVRDVAGGDGGLGTAVNRGVVQSPRYLYTGAALSQTGGHGDSRPGHLSAPLPPGASNELVDGPDEVARAVRRRFRDGCHAIKLMVSGGVTSPTDPLEVPQFGPSEIRTAVDESARRGTYVAAHAYSSEAISHAVVNGVRTIEHGNLLAPSSAKDMANSGAYLVPTLIAYDAMSRRADEVGLSAVAREKNQIVLHEGRKAVELASEYGIPTGFGSDLLGELADDQLLGLQLQCEIVGVLETLRSVSSINADVLGDRSIGRVREGCRGDLLILDGNPFEESSCLWAPGDARTVIQSGTVVGDTHS